MSTLKVKKRFSRGAAKIGTGRKVNTAHRTTANTRQNGLVRLFMEEMMSAQNVTGIFSACAKNFGICALTFASVVFAPLMANAQDADRTPEGFIATAEEGGNKFCLPLAKARRVKGLSLGAGASAIRHSENNIGTLAIAVFPGSDMYDTPAQLTTLFRNNGVKADCFINDIPLKKSGTVFIFYVGGLPVDYKGQMSFGIQELRDNRDILRSVRAEAGMAEIFLTDKYRAKPE